MFDEDIVQNYVEALNVIEKSDTYFEHVKANIFSQFSIKKGFKNFLDECKCSVMKEIDNICCQKVFGKVVDEPLTR